MCLQEAGRQNWCTILVPAQPYPDMPLSSEQQWWWYTVPLWSAWSAGSTQQAGLEYTLTTQSMGLFTFLKLSTYLRYDSPTLSLWGSGCCSGWHSFWTRKCSLLCKLMALNSTVQATSWSKCLCFAVSSRLQRPQMGYSVTYTFQCSTLSTHMNSFSYNLLWSLSQRSQHSSKSIS